MGQDRQKPNKNGGQPDRAVPSPDALQAELTECRRRIAELEAAQAARARTEEQLRDSDQRYRLLVESIQEGLGIVDPDENIVFANQAYADILGCSRAELIGTNLRTILPDEEWDRVRTETSVRKAGKTSIYELSVRRKDGALRQIRVSAVPWINGGGRFVGTIGCILDVTAQMRAQTALRTTMDRLRKAVEGTVQAAAAISEKRDPYTAGHQRRVAKISAAIARELGLGPEQVEGVFLSALTHDVGKISIPAEILAKPGRLLSVEFELIKTHARLGHEILKGIEFPWPIALVALQHHERLDGSGYPDHLRGNAISFEARIVAVADVVEAMASHRPYRAAVGIAAALDEIRLNRGTKFDPSVVDACLAVCARGPLELD